MPSAASISCNLSNKDTLKQTTNSKKETSNTDNHLAPSTNSTRTTNSNCDRGLAKHQPTKVVIEKKKETDNDTNILYLPGEIMVNVD